MRRVILLLLLLLEMIMGVDLTLEEVSQKIDKDISNHKVYFGERLFKGKFKDNKQLIYTSDYIINIGDVVSV